jgi:hypothetical protein
MIVYFSTVVRAAPLDQGGELVKLDWASKRVLARTPIVPPQPQINDPNPRGGARGGRGILVTDSALYVACYHTLLVFDHHLQPVRTITNPLFADLHELLRDKEHIWATSTALDGALKVDEAGNTVESWWPREDEAVAGRYRLGPLALDKALDNRLSYQGTAHKQPGHTHLNAVGMLDGRPLVLLNKFGCLVQLNPTRVLVEDGRLAGCHNVLVTPNRRILINDTVNQAVAMYDSEGVLLKRFELKQYWPVRKIRWRFCLRDVRIWVGERMPSFKLYWFLVRNVISSRPVFVRGLCATHRNTILVGLSPATILEIEPESGRLVDHFTYSHDLNVTVHGLACAEQTPAR